MLSVPNSSFSVGPDVVTIGGTREARGGDTVHLTCVTSSSNPPANITWVINGKAFNNVSDLDQTVDANRTLYSLIINCADRGCLCHDLNIEMEVVNN